MDEFGDTGAKITFPNKENAPSLPENAYERAVRFQPDQLKLEMLSGSTQFGYSFDDWGHLFYTSNANHLFHEVIAARYLVGKEDLPLRSTTQYLPEYGPGAEIYPITDNPEHQVLTDVGTITSSCGVTVYQGGSFSEAYNGVVFIAEPVHNLIHTDILVENGATYHAKRQFEQQEFLASKDSWFRPVNFYIGPSGDLYVIDYYRQYIEHPEWMAKEIVESGQLYNGLDKGRIYRITLKDKPSTSSEADFTKMTIEQMIPLLESPNIWWRRNAQRLLVQSKDVNLGPQLIEFTKSTSSPIGFVHGLWTLEGLGLFDPALLGQAINHAHSGVIENALKILELHPEEWPALQQGRYSVKGIN